MARRAAPEPAPTLRSGDLARRFNLSPDTLRHYEHLGLLPVPPRAPNGYRQYPPEAVARVGLIQGALAAGFTLRELAEVLGERDRGGAPCRRVHQLAVNKLELVEERLRELEELRSVLRRLIDGWGQRLDSAPGDGRLHLLECLSLEAPANQRRRPPAPNLQRASKKEP